jgi:GDP-mannose 6-dehydrogenase
MKVAVIGIGYVGAVSAACLARDGHEVIAVDVSPVKIDGINAGESPIVEPGLDELIKSAVSSGRLRATDDLPSTIRQTDISLICVGTPSRMNGSLDTGFALRVAEQIGEVLKEGVDHSVVFRSTVLPGTMDGLLIPALERTSGKKAGEDFGIGYYPEFLRESTAIKDYDQPGAVVFGRRDEKTLERLHALQPGIPVKPAEVDIKAAEAIKYFNNAWHALKISFSNEAGNICKAVGIDSHEVMGILCSDTRLNISPAYMKPGFAFGGSCLPKDVRALKAKARELDVASPILDAILTANDEQIQSAYRLVQSSGKRKVGVLGLSFKSDTDDLRESPMVVLTERLLGKGYEVKVYDPNIRLSRLTGTNLRYIQEYLPHIGRMLREEPGEVLDSEVLVVSHKNLGELITPQMQDGKYIVDLARLWGAKLSDGNYQGICW